ncbi:MAG: prepilin-type N-terminal cleavage/methylation domain-containing protein, partial [Bacilli bacterium]
MKRKGFTIIEIIISLVILVSIGLVVGVSLNKVFKNTEEAEADSFKDQIITSADLYIANNQSKINELQTTKGYLLIPVGDLIEAGLLDGNAIDPETGEKVSHDNLVKVSLDANGLLKIEYNMDSPNEPYLEAQTLIIDYNENFNCQNIESYRDEWGTQTLRLIDTNGDVMSASIDDVISKIECDIDTSKPGSNQINYVYKTHVDAPLKSLSRTAVVSASPSDIITLSAVANPDTVTINNPITFTVTGTDRVGNQSVLNTSDYIIEAHSTNKVGTFSPVITYNKNNSDGSKPTTTVTYTVNYDPNDIVSLSATASPTKVIVNGNVTFKVTGTTRSGTKKTLTPSDYTIAQNSTTSAGVKKPTFTYNKTNSDGSKPTTTVTYTVIDSISAIIDLDSNCIKQSDGSCWYIGNQSGNYLTYLGKTWRIYKKDAA